MKKVILRTPMRTRSNSFNQSILFAQKSVVSFISGGYLVHNKKMNVYIIDSNSVMKRYLIQQPK
jgi:hypothetical protein